MPLPQHFSGNALMMKEGRLPFPFGTAAAETLGAPYHQVVFQPRDAVRHPEFPRPAGRADGLSLSGEPAEKGCLAAFDNGEGEGRFDGLSRLSLETRIHSPISSSHHHISPFGPGRV